MFKIIARTISLESSRKCRFLIKFIAARIELHATIKGRMFAEYLKGVDTIYMSEMLKTGGNAKTLWVNVYQEFQLKKCVAQLLIITAMYALIFHLC